MTNDNIHDDVRAYYREAAQTRGAYGDNDQRWEASRYDIDTIDARTQTCREPAHGLWQPVRHG